MADDSPPSWQQVARERKQKQIDSIPKEWLIDTSALDDRSHVMDVPLTCGLLTERELEITEVSDVDYILQKLASAEWSSVEVTTAYYKRAIIAHQLTNCLTEIFVERALARAAEVDDHLKRTGNPIGALHGLPISLKDQFCMKGLETIMGYVSWVGKYSEEDAVIVQTIYELGAVPFVRTNVPQTLMWGETHNLVFGRTTNPYNRSLTPGGSSGGEGALLALKGSPLGIGTDIGGSVRIPASFCGLYALRPSYERLPYQGALNSAEGQESVSSVLGPMCASLSGLRAFTKAVIDSEPWRKDPLALRKRWDEEGYALREHGGGAGEQGRMCFAFMWDDGIVKPMPPVWRAMEMTKRALVAAGHKVIDWENLKHMEIFVNVNTIFCADDGEDFRRSCAPLSEPLLQTMSPTTSKRSEALDQPLEKSVVRDTGAHSAYELWQLHKERRALRKDYLDHWEKTVEVTGTGRPVDAIICPAEPYPAVPHGHNINAFYTTIWNALDYATSVFPVTTVDATLDPPAPPHEFYNTEDKLVYEMYVPEDFEGAPVGLQLVGRPQEEEAVIGMTEVVDAALKAFERTVVVVAAEMA